MSEGMSSRLKMLRKEKGLTLEQVATAVGVGKSTVRKWETGMIANMKRDKIASLAAVLGTTPAYLIGWEESEKNAPGKDNLTEDEKEWLDFFRQIPEEQKPLTLEVFKTFRKIPEDRQAEALELLQVALRMQKRS
jgi:transcriptional regulator with XRE-family HTH domain